MQPTNSKAHYWLQLIASAPGKTISFFPEDFKTLQTIAHVPPLKVYKNKEGNPSVFVLDKVDAIKRIKDRCGFFTTSEATKELHNAYKEST